MTKIVKANIRQSAFFNHPPKVHGDCIRGERSQAALAYTQDNGAVNAKADKAEKINFVFIIVEAQFKLKLCLDNFV